MIERRLLGTGPSPATPPPQPSASRRARLAAEGTTTAPPAQERPAQGLNSEQSPVEGRRPLGPGPATS
ncbi:hypothetical protein AB0O22_17475 [Streptomyces sp. NPDC091204]|uniref:hypothetical protein n=1 Tax=Streptomyces sp. NPDC091204 TaxID=3155299 RepID=UPI00342031CD